MLSYGLERKEAFQEDKSVNFVMSKKWVFSKGVNPWFWSKNPKRFLHCFKVKLTCVLERRQGFLDYKNDLKARSKDFHFSKGVNPWLKFLG